MNCDFCNIFHINIFKNSDPLNCSYQILDGDIIFISVWGPWSTSVFV
jgi:hypothetical protein